jgi:DNA-binding NarL/FixJ family response regulator
MPIKLLLVDDNALFRNGVARILEADGRFDVVGLAANGADAVTATGRLRPDLILMDLSMPVMPGEEAIRQIRLRDPEVPICVLTVFESDERVEDAMEAGATLCLAKDTTPERLCQSLFDLARGQPASTLPAVARSGAAPTNGRLLKNLTPREYEVLISLATSASYQAIAKGLGISPKTLRNHISNIYHKLQIHDRAQAVIRAVQEGVVDLPRPGQRDGAAPQNGKADESVRGRSISPSPPRAGGS